MSWFPFQLVSGVSSNHSWSAVFLGVKNNISCFYAQDWKQYGLRCRASTLKTDSNTDLDIVCPRSTLTAVLTSASCVNAHKTDINTAILTPMSPKGRFWGLQTPPRPLPPRRWWKHCSPWKPCKLCKRPQQSGCPGVPVRDRGGVPFRSGRRTGGGGWRVDDEQIFVKVRTQQQIMKCRKHRCKFGNSFGVVYCYKMINKI